MFKTRIESVLAKIEENNWDGMLINKPENIRYLSGFTAGADAMLLISPEQQVIFTDSRYEEQVKRECPAWELRLQSSLNLQELQDISKNFKKIGIESHAVSYQDYIDMSQKLNCELVPQPGMVEELRQVKDEEELELLRSAAQIGDRTFDQILKSIRPGISEKAIANQLVFYLKENGCEKESFDTIIISGLNTALPHGQPGNKLLEAGEMLTMDYGGFYQGYAGDMTRTIAIGKADSIFRDRYYALLEAQQLGLSKVMAGASCREIDLAVREVLKKYNLDTFFAHGTGHGVGLEIHESPRLSHNSDDILQKNMVVTIEPGVYIPGWGGIRIEDTVIVKDGGCEIITHSNKNLLIVDGGII
jgi:Xaa-Pro aminopeptidase